MDAREPTQIGCLRRPIPDWRDVGRAALAVLAAGLIVSWVPWRDRVELRDGRRVTLVAEGGGQWAVREGIGTSVEAIHSTEIRAREPGLRSLLRRLTPMWFLACAGCSLLGGIALVLRWRCVLAPFGVRATFRWCGIHWARSQILSALPTSQLGADLYRAERGRHLTGSLATSLGAVCLERLLGLIALLGVAAIGIAVSGRREFMTELARLAGIGTGAVIVLFATASAGSRIRASRTVASLLRDRLPLRVRGISTNVVRPIADRPSCVAVGLLLSGVAQAATPLTYLAADRALGLDTPGWCYCVAVPALLLVQYLPVHVAGVGIIEGGLWYLLSRMADRGLADAVAVACVVRIWGLFWLAALALAFWVKPGIGRGAESTSGDRRGAAASAVGATSEAGTPVSLAVAEGRREAL